MAERTVSQVWGMRLVYVCLTLLICFAHLLPINGGSIRGVTPDFLVAITFAWALRRPDYVPALLIAGALLLTDFLLQRPPGLWAALVLLAAEWLKSQNKRLRDSGFVAEWINVAILLALITVLYRMVLGLLIVAPGTFFLATMQYLVTLAAYPILAALSSLVLGVRRSGPGEFDPVGRRT